MFDFGLLVRSLLSVVAILGSAAPIWAEPRKETLRIHIDADFNMTEVATQSIMQGIKTALSELGGAMAGHPIELVPVDHRGTPKRSKNNMRKFRHDPGGLAIIGGKQSPPYLTYGAFANEHRLPLLLPWSAAGPITRQAEGDDNYIFRLSVDDSKAGPFLVKTAIAHGCQNIAGVLVDTGWGRANLKTITASVLDNGLTMSAVEFVSNTIGPIKAQGTARELAAANVDCVILVVTANAGAEVANALHDHLPDVRVFAHWGIIGGSFADQVPRQVREALGIQVLQTCGLESERRGNPILDRALGYLSDPMVEEIGLGGLGAPTGFVHGYDLTLILAAAVEQAAATPAWANGTKARRTALKQALETLDTPVAAILRTYDRPFSRSMSGRPDAHEALGDDDLCMSAFDAQGYLTTAPRLAKEG